MRLRPRARSACARGSPTASSASRRWTARPSQALARRAGAGGVLSPGTDGPVRVAAEVAAALGLPHPLDVATAARVTDKREQRRAFDREGVPHPAWSEDGAACRPGRASSSSPPRRRVSAGSRSSRRAATWRAAVEAAQAISRDGRALCEEFVEGPELTVNAFVDGGRFVHADRHRPRAGAGVRRRDRPPLPLAARRSRRSSRRPRRRAGRSASRPGRRTRRCC